MPGIVLSTRDVTVISKVYGPCPYKADSLAVISKK